MYKIIDWEAVKAFIKERQPVEVSAGLLEDWYWTGATVYENRGWKEDNGAYIHSYWATPGVKAEMPNGDVIEKVFFREMAEEDHAIEKKKMEETMAKVRAYVETMKKEREAKP